MRREIASSPLASLLMLRSVRLLAPSFALFAGVVGFGLGAASYGKGISLASSPKEAAPLAVPFMLCAVAAAGSVALCAASLCDATERLPRRFSRLS
jgi:hypothetical protein